MGEVLLPLLRGGSRARLAVVDRDEAGQVTQVCREGVSTEFRYDGACQLVEARRGDSVTRWRYDSCGRLVSETTDNAVRERAYDAAGQLLGSPAAQNTAPVRLVLLDQHYRTDWEYTPALLDAAERAIPTMCARKSRPESSRSKPSRSGM